VAVDSMKPTVFCITEGGELLRWFDCTNYMREPSDITIFANEYYICDFKVNIPVSDSVVNTSSVVFVTDVCKCSYFGTVFHISNVNSSMS